MGRPINKRWIDSGPGNQIKIVSWVPGTSDLNGTEGFITSQKGSTTYRVTDFNGASGECQLVDKADGDLLEGEMNIPCVTDAGADRVVKLYNRTIIIGSTGLQEGWTFTVDGGDGLTQLIALLEVAISAQPVDDTSSTGAASYTVTTNALAGEAFQWEVSDDAGATWADATGVIDSVTYTDDTTDTLVLAGVANTTPPISNLYRVIITATNAVPATSDGAATLIFGS